jgi:hypothetical protein
LVGVDQDIKSDWIDVALLGQNRLQGEHSGFGLTEIAVIFAAMVVVVIGSHLEILSEFALFVSAYAEPVLPTK